MTSQNPQQSSTAEISNVIDDVDYFFPEENDIIDTEATIVGALKIFMACSGFPDDIELIVRERDVTDIAIRILKREEYYHHFHDIAISEAKRTALIAYWIVKLRPFTVADERYVGSNAAACINERFAAFILVSGACMGRDRDAIDEIDFDSAYMQKLVYSFRYRTIGIDGFILLAEGMTPASFEQSFSERL